MGKKLKMMDSCGWIFRGGNRGVKGFEIAIQDKIDEVIPQGLSWWQVVTKNIFMEVLAIYEEHKNNDAEIMMGLMSLYEDIKKQVDKFNTDINTFGYALDIRGKKRDINGDVIVDEQSKTDKA